MICDTLWRCLGEKFGEGDSLYGGFCLYRNGHVISKSEQESPALGDGCLLARALMLALA